MEYLYKKLKDHAVSGHYGFHMPGHKRNAALTGAELPYDIDITEIEGFDDLHHAEGILKGTQERASRIYHAEETHYLINGSTAGILSAVLGSTRPGDTILMARNCHRSVYNAVLLNDLRPIYIYPPSLEKGGLNMEISPEQVESLLRQDPGIKAVVIASPTYDGVVSDIRRIADAVHRKRIPLILDEAHGAHFGFHPVFPENGNVQGADIVIHSLHKTLPALTQTALLHMNGNIADRKRVRKYLHMLQSSSPSYVLMAGIDECIRLLEERQTEVFDHYVQLLENTRARLKGLRNLELIETESYDRSKIIISCAGCVREEFGDIKKFTGKDLYNALNNKYLLQMEMAAASYVIAMTSPADTEEGMERLVCALQEIDGNLMSFVPGSAEGFPHGSGAVQGGNVQVYLPGRAERMKEEYEHLDESRLVRDAGGNSARATEYIPLAECAGRVVLEYAYAYPPGIPLTVPGERASEETAELLRQYESAGLRIEGTEIQGKIEVLMNG